MWKCVWPVLRTVVGSVRLWARGGNIWGSVSQKWWNRTLSPFLRVCVCMCVWDPLCNPPLLNTYDVALHKRVPFLLDSFVKYSQILLLSDLISLSFLNVFLFVLFFSPDYSNLFKLGRSELTDEQLRRCSSVLTSSPSTGTTARPKLPTWGERLHNAWPLQSWQQQPSQQPSIHKYYSRLHGFCHWFSKFM